MIEEVTHEDERSTVALEQKVRATAIDERRSKRSGGPRVDRVEWDWAVGEHPASLEKRPEGDMDASGTGGPYPEEDSPELVEVPVDSLEASVGYGTLLRQMHRSFLRKVAFYRSPAGGTLSVEAAREAAFHAPEDEAESAKRLEELMRLPLESVDFVDVMELQLNDPFGAEWFWQRVKQEGRAEFESGHAAANATLPLDSAKELWNVAKYLGVRESFAHEWQPQGGVEIALIDMLAQSWFQWQFWVSECSLRAQTRPREPDPEFEAWKAMKSREAAQGRRSCTSGEWDPPLTSEVESIEHAVQMADRWNRMFMRTIRQMRDLRRYTPVLIGKADQVNIAQQQVNLAAERT